MLAVTDSRAGVVTLTRHSERTPCRNIASCFSYPDSLWRADKIPCILLLFILFRISLVNLFCHPFSSCALGDCARRNAESRCGPKTTTRSQKRNRGSERNIARTSDCRCVPALSVEMDVKSRVLGMKLPFNDEEAIC